MQGPSVPASPACTVSASSPAAASAKGEEAVCRASCAPSPTRLLAAACAGATNFRFRGLELRAAGVAALLSPGRVMKLSSLCDWLSVRTISVTLTAALPLSDGFLTPGTELSAGPPLTTLWEHEHLEHQGMHWRASFPAACPGQAHGKGVAPDGALLQLLHSIGDGLDNGILMQQDDLVLGGVHVDVHLIARDGNVLQGILPLIMAGRGHTVLVGSRSLLPGTQRASRGHVGCTGPQCCAPGVCTGPGGH